ncbi:collagen-binding domain-containing protein [Companilactobacillus baiquanensis]|uniref:Collagen-binding domain-containing protein n=1 Tax=Companilactobacillus baiquanensis TaxID=2486005 RepID=A0ABW1USR3_9LACO|nr:collagen-binding domain-containing protein [Companilactobacillus baiquanensis]
MTKKGSKWALSCVATSAAVLSFIVVSNNTYADEVSSNTQPATDVTTSTTTNTDTDQTNNQQTDHQSAPVQTQQTKAPTNAVSTNSNRMYIQSMAQAPTTQAPAQTTTQATSSNTTQPATYAANSDVQDGGNVEDDLPSKTNLLDYAAYFHIFANEATLNAHTNGNIAVGTLNGNVNFGTNIKEELLDKDISYIQNINKIASSSFVSAGNNRTNKVVFGDNVDVNVSNPNRTNVDGTDIDSLTKSETYEDKNGNVYIDFAKIFSELDVKSEAYSLMDPNVEITASDFPDQNNRVINLQDYRPNDQNQIVINLSKDVLNSNTPLTIAGLSKDPDGTTVIINVDTEGDPDYTITSQIKVIYNNNEDRPDPSETSDEERPNQETEYFGDNHLLWNFYDSTASNKIYNGTINVDRPFQGSILAPAATINANQNLDGNIVADKVNVNAETHRWDLQDSSDKETDFEEPMTLPGIDVQLPDENEDGGNEGIDPEEPLVPDENDGNEDGETPTDPEKPDENDGNEDGETPTDPEKPDENDGNEEDETPTDSEYPEESDENNGDSEGLLPGGSITNGSSENNQDGLITGSTNATTNKSTGASFPQTGMKTTGLISLLGVVLAAIVGVFGYKKRKDI